VRLPDRPHIGLVLSYSYLWADESKQGRKEGSKDRPAAIIFTRRDLGPSEVVYVVPITHSAPTEKNEKIPIPATVKRHLGLDDEPSWIDVTEVNIFVWPGPDLRPIRQTRRGNRNDDRCFYGFLPRGLFQKVQRAFVVNHRRKHVLVTKRGA